MEITAFDQKAAVGYHKSIIVSVLSRRNSPKSLRLKHRFSSFPLCDVSMKIYFNATKHSQITLQKINKARLKIDISGIHSSLMIENLKPFYGRFLPATLFSQRIDWYQIPIAILSFFRYGTAE